jgi:hypothetical protein
MTGSTPMARPFSSRTHHAVGRSHAFNSSPSTTRARAVTTSSLATRPRDEPKLNNPDMSYSDVRA